ncbi:hypothetical protein [Streptomyces sp. NPDC020747]|uniref:hypothetical protein n=1 Tax=Streptomyces sp. NPDC020747 TaxID=3365086 RepID=UPI00379059E3
MRLSTHDTVQRICTVRLHPQPGGPLLSCPHCALHGYRLPASSALPQAHPDRTIKTTVVRTTVEGLVARSHAHRTKQGSSVFYTATTAPQSAEPEPEAAAS